MEAHLASKQPVQVNKISYSCEIYSGPHDTQCCMENPEQAFVDYAFSRTNEAGDPQCLSHPPNSINAVKTYSKETNHYQKDQLQKAMEIKTRQTKEPEQTLEDEFKDLHLNLPILEVLAHASMHNTILDKYIESLELGKNGFAFIQGEMPKRMEEPGYSLYLLNIGPLKETNHVFGLPNGTKSYHVRIVKDVEVHIGRLKLLNYFYVIDMEKYPKTHLLVGRGFLATTNAFINCRKAKIAIGERITMLVFRVKRIKLGEEEAPYWTTLGKRESCKSRPSSDGMGAQTLTMLERNS
nr:DNA-directed DNA polymerase [Tanacetum cinerariifolium]